MEFSGPTFPPLEAYSNEGATSPKLNDGLSDVVVKMGVELVWANPPEDMAEKIRRQQVDVEMQRKIYELRKEMRSRILGLIR